MKSRFAENAWISVRDALQTGEPVIAILPCGATEAHGPHLPLNTDVIISEGMARRALPELHAKGYVAAILPSLAYMPAGYAEAFQGTIAVSATTAKAMLLDIAKSLKEQGFACLALANSHFDPANVSMLRETAKDIVVLGLPVAFPDFTRRVLAQTLTAEFRSGACHAGQFESSIMLAERPDLVDETKRARLPDNPASLTDAFSRGATTFEQAGGPDAYFGFPRLAAATEGTQSLEIMATALVAAIEEALSAVR